MSEEAASKPVFIISAEYIEKVIHDALIASLMPYDEPIEPGGYVDRPLLDSAANRLFRHLTESSYTILWKKKRRLFFIHSFAITALATEISEQA